MAKVLKIFRDLTLGKLWLRLRFLGHPQNLFGKMYKDGTSRRDEQNCLLESCGDHAGLTLIHWESEGFPVLTSNHHPRKPIFALAQNDIRLAALGLNVAVETFLRTRQDKHLRFVDGSWSNE